MHTWLHVAAMPLAAAAAILMGGGSDAQCVRALANPLPPSSLHDLMVITPHLNKKKPVTLNWVVQRLQLICFTCSCSA